MTDDRIYDHYNREERYLCTHLFRLLHEPVNNHLALRTFLGREDVADFRIFSEVALIRDAYYARRRAPGDPIVFMDELVSHIAKQQGVAAATLYSALPENLRNPSLTHPRDIGFKGRDKFQADDVTVYGAIQGMFNAKPDLTICVGHDLFVYEAKFTLGFDENQLTRTSTIASVWAALLYKDLGFSQPPTPTVRKLGLRKHSPDISWEDVATIADKTYPQGDRTLQAIRNAVAAAH